MKIYQLVAKGELRATGSLGATMSKKLYRSRERAEAAIPAFRASCEEVRDGSLGDMDVRRVTVVEFELEDE